MPYRRKSSSPRRRSSSRRRGSPRSKVASVLVPRHGKRCGRGAYTTENYCRYRKNSPDSLRRQGYSRFRTVSRGRGDTKVVVAYKGGRERSSSRRRRRSSYRRRR